MMSLYAGFFLELKVYREMIKQHNIKAQAGFALITVLLVVALVTIIATQLIYQQSLTVQRSINILHQSQATAVAWGLETWIKKALALDAKYSKTDNLEEQWAQPMFPVPFEDGEISGQLFDLQGRINLNNLQERDKNKLKLWQAIVQRLLVQQGLDVNLHEVITDWVDIDNNASINGAESDTYLLKKPAYRAANQKLVLVQELGLLEGFNAKIVKQITPFVTALPKITKINVNTAEIVVLQALTDWMTEEIATMWVKQRKENPAQKTVNFLNFLAEQLPVFTLAEIKKDLPDSLIDVKSDYFFLVGKIEYGEARQTLLGIFMRDDRKNVKLVQRWVGVTDE